MTFPEAPPRAGAPGTKSEGARSVGDNDVVILPRGVDIRDLDYDAANLVGALLHLPVGVGRQVVAKVRDGDIDDARLALVLRLVRDLLNRGTRPDPGAVHAFAMESGAVQSSSLPALAALLADLLTSVPMPTSAAMYARAVVAGSVRRRFVESARRLGQVSESAPNDVLIDVWQKERAAVDAAAARLTEVAR